MLQTWDLDEDKRPNFTTIRKWFEKSQNLNNVNDPNKNYNSDDYHLVQDKDDDKHPRRYDKKRSEGYQKDGDKPAQEQDEVEVYIGNVMEVGQQCKQMEQDNHYDDKPYDDKHYNDKHYHVT